MRNSKIHDKKSQKNKALLVLLLFLVALLFLISITKVGAII